MIWLIGCNGMLGTELSHQLKENSLDFIGTDREVDFTDFSSIESFVNKNTFGTKKIDFIINCAAFTAVDKAESEEETALLLNQKGPENLSLLANKIDATLIHISTDYVFDGCGIKDSSGKIIPYTEDSLCNPVSAYGRTKLLGEKSVCANAKKYYILRTAWLYGWAGKNFVYTMIRAMNTHEEVKVVNDQKGSPTFAGNLSSVIIKIIKQNIKNSAENKNADAERFDTENKISDAESSCTQTKNKNASAKSNKIPYGIYHYTDFGEISWWDFTNEIKKQGIKYGFVTNKDCVVKPCSTAEYPTPAKRPEYSVLSKEKIKKGLGISIPDWKEGLSAFLSSPLFDESRIK